MSNIRKSLLKFVFSGSCMRRWNDKLRPVELYEVDKQAHKIIAAFFLYKLQARKMSTEESLELGQQVIEGCLFDYFYRLVITDIKPPIFYKIKANKDHYNSLTEYVLTELEPLVRPLDEKFWQRLENYHRFPEVREYSLANRILRAAHLYASKWEFMLIRPLNHFDEELREIYAGFNEELAQMSDLAGVPELMAGENNPLVRITNLCGQLRFQIRWSQIPRVPTTSVLGHMFVVAAYSYFASFTLNACKARLLNNFFCGLFHDLPELLTRDIISPVKHSVENFKTILREYEEDELERRIYIPLKNNGYADIAASFEYLLGAGMKSEFLQTIQDENKVAHAIDSFEEMHLEYNEDKFNPKDGKLVKICDNLAAFLEAHTSVQNGISSPQLYEAMARIKDEYRHMNLGNFNVNTLLADFD